MQKMISKSAVGALALLVVVACGSEDDKGPSGSSTGGGGGTSGSSTGGGGGTSGASTGGFGGDGTGGLAGEGGSASCESLEIENDIEIAGAYRDNFGGSHRVDDERWTQGDSHFEIAEYDNDMGWVVAHNSEDNDFNPGAYSRFDWTLEAGSLYYCQPVYDADSADEARDGASSDAEDLESGCGGFSWSQLSAIALLGSFVDSFGGSHEISAPLWISGSSNFHLLEISNDESWAVAQNDCQNPYNPGLFSRFDWFVGGDSGGEGGSAGASPGEGTYYCQTGYDLESEADAKELAPADVSDLDAGCNGFGWSELLAP
jgi:hypothetical protein